MFAAKIRKRTSLCFCKWYRTVEREAAGSSGLGRWIWNLEVPGSNPPPYYYLDYCGLNKSWNKYHLRQVGTWRQIYHLTVSCSGRITEFRLQSRYQLMYQSNRSFNIPPPRATPGYLYFLQNFCSNSPLPRPKAVQMPHHRSIPGDQMPPPPGNFSVAFIMLRKLCM